MIHWSSDLKYLLYSCREICVLYLWLMILLILSLSMCHFLIVHQIIWQLMDVKEFGCIFCSLITPFWSNNDRWSNCLQSLFELILFLQIEMFSVPMVYDTFNTFIWAHVIFWYLDSYISKQVCLRRVTKALQFWYCLKSWVLTAFATTYLHELHVILLWIQLYLSSSSHQSCRYAI